MNKLEFGKENKIDFKMLNQNVKLYIGDNLRVMKKLLEEGKKFDFIYFDPPYNIGRKGVLYKDNYDNWERMITDRLVVGKDLLSNKGFLAVSINDIKFNELRRILEKVFYDKKIDILKRQKFFYLKRKIPNVNPIYEYVFVVHTKDNSYDGKILNSSGEWSYDKSIVIEYGIDKYFTFPKPTELFEKLFSLYTEKSEKLKFLDAFAGSGSSIIALENLKKKQAIEDYEAVYIQKNEKVKNKFGNMPDTTKALFDLLNLGFSIEKI